MFLLFFLFAFATMFFSLDETKFMYYLKDVVTDCIVQSLLDGVRDSFLPAYDFQQEENFVQNILLTQMESFVPVKDYIMLQQDNLKQEDEAEQEKKNEVKEGADQDSWVEIEGEKIEGGEIEGGEIEGGEIEGEKIGSQSGIEVSKADHPGENAEKWITWDELTENIFSETDSDVFDASEGIVDEFIQDNRDLEEFGSEYIMPEEQNLSDEMTELHNEYGEAISEDPFTDPLEPAQIIDYDELTDFETLVQRYYIVDESTMTNANELNAAAFLEKDLTIDKNTDGPQILIYHTHSQEAYVDSVAGDEGTTVMGMGDRLTEILTSKYGFQVLHHRGKYDVVSRDYAYTDALPEIEKILEENPSIQVVVDLHRDAVPEHTRLVMDVDGRPTARFMFFNGMSRLKTTGDIAYLQNDYLQDNLALSFQMQMASESYYPGLARKIYLKGYRYNMHLKPRCMLIELGAQNNTVEEAQNACDILAFLLNQVLTGESNLQNN